MITRTYTDNRALEALLGERWCHVLNAHGQPLCGGSGILGAKLLPEHRGHLGAERCTGCGLRNCPDCALTYREGQR